MPRGTWFPLAWFISLLSIGCDSGTVEAPDVLPELIGAEARPDTVSVLRATVLVRVRHADSVAVSWRLSGATEEYLTPAVAVSGDSARVPVLGLFAAARHTISILMWAHGRRSPGGEVELTTGPLPADLPVFTAGGPDPYPGYVVFQSGSYGLAIDTSGRVVWYHRFPSGPGLNFQVQPNGRYVARPPGGSGLWTEVDPMGTVTRTFGCASGMATRFHDVIVEAGGGYWTMCDDVRRLDLSALGGRVDALVSGTAVQHFSASGSLLFSWTPFDHLNIADLDPFERGNAAVNWTHGNALALDDEGNLLLSLRNLSAVLKIDTRTGAVLWQLGGAASQLAAINGTMPLFIRQHGLRLAGPNRFVLLDNLGDPARSRVEWYEVDELNRTARLIGDVGTADGVVAQQGGSTQLLPEGRVLVAYGNGNRVEEYDADGRLVWRIHGNPGYVFRAERIGSLYHPGQPLSRQH